MFTIINLQWDGYENSLNKLSHSFITLAVERGQRSASIREFSVSLLQDLNEQTILQQSLVW